MASPTQLDMSLSKLWEMVKHREAWYAAVQPVSSVAQSCPTLCDSEDGSHEIKGRCSYGVTEIATERQEQQHGAVRGYACLSGLAGSLSHGAAGVGQPS